MGSPPIQIEPALSPPAAYLRMLSVQNCSPRPPLHSKMGPLTNLKRTTRTSNPASTRTVVGSNNSLLTGLGLICLKTWRHFSRKTVDLKRLPTGGKIAS